MSQVAAPRPVVLAGESGSGAKSPTETCDLAQGVNTPDPGREAGLLFSGLVALVHPYLLDLLLWYRNGAESACVCTHAQGGIEKAHLFSLIIQRNTLFYM